MQRLKDRVCLVTGAARGIGKGIARRLLEEGAKVWICDLAPEAVERAASDLAALGEVSGDVADVSQRSQVEVMVGAVVERWGRLDVLVSNAGIAHTVPFLQLTDADWDRTLDTNLRGTFLCCQAAARQMVQQGAGGAIVTIGSTNGLRGQPLLADYGVSKAAIINLTLTLALELVEHNIRANVVCPGTIWTEHAMQAGWSDELWDNLRQHTARGRLGTPADVAAAVAYLASDDADFVTGHILVVDGGLTARQLLTPLEPHQPSS